ncbi:hypothetical protein NR402_12765 [Acidithiobacillus ferrooxidans]|jgi:hypothetical protein|uniref:hypothetical protein n=1 Tax=Acidithiobacillus ferrooxidans TaxID=920 RepID=UPI000A6FCE15|nr:hypothetical protein [Acidithiobacillus ferrooxidans]MCR2831148.1 hypothetical protein [Acidithiobacillus ferrooxidans]
MELRESDLSAEVTELLSDITLMGPDNGMDEIIANQRERWKTLTAYGNAEMGILFQKQWGLARTGASGGSATARSAASDLSLIIEMETVLQAITHENVMQWAKHV